MGVFGCKYFRKYLSYRKLAKNSSELNCVTNVENVLKIVKL